MVLECYESIRILGVKWALLKHKIIAVGFVVVIQS
jgi:hypothetical protein